MDTTTSLMTALQFQHFLPEMILAGMILFIMIADLFTAREARVAYYLSQLTLVGLFCIDLYHINTPTRLLFGAQIELSHLSIMLHLTMYLIVFLTFAYTLQYMEKNKTIAFGEYYVLTLLSLLGAMILVEANNLLVLYAALELMSLPMYALIAIKRYSAFAAESAAKYFVLGAIASGFLLYSISFIYGLTGSINISTIHTLFLNNPNMLLDSQLLTFSLIMLILAATFKLGVVPFHQWLPDVYTGSPNLITPYIATVPKLAALGMLLILLPKLFMSDYIHWGQILLVIGMISIFLGNIVALAQKNIKRMLSYSAISHVGFILVAISLGTQSAYNVALYYTIIYALMSLGCFAIITLLSTEKHDVHALNEFAGLNTRKPWLALMMLMLLFSMAGIPPFVGFSIKLLLIKLLIHKNHFYIATYVLIMSVVGAFYYLKIIKSMYFEKPNTTRSLNISASSKAAITFNGWCVLLLGVFPAFFMLLCQFNLN